MKYNMLEVISSKTEAGATWYNCRCECGKEKLIRADSVRRGLTKSCGCLYKTSSKENGKAYKGTHGMSRTSIYVVWCGIKNRCKSEPSYQDVPLCEEWQDFEPFYHWAINNGYVEGLTIDREDTYGGYSPGNCRWIPGSVNYSRPKRKYKKRGNNAASTKR